MRHLIIAFVILPLTFLSQTSYIDSLSNVTYNSPNSNDSIQMQNFVLLFRAHAANKTLDSILPLSEKAIVFAKRTKHPEYLTSAYNLKALYFKFTKNNDEAIKLFNIAYNYSEQIKTPLRIQCVVNYNLSHSHTILGNLDSSFFYAKKTLDAAIKTKEINFQTLAFSSIAKYYIKKGSFPTALDYLNKSLKLAISENDTARIISAKLNIGKVLSDNNKHEEMIALYHNLLEDYDSVTLASQIDLINLNIGHAYAELEMFEKSLEYTYRVLNSNSNIRRGLAYGNIGDIYLQLLKSGTPPNEIPLVQQIDLENDNVKNKELILSIISDYFTKSFNDFDELNAANYKIYPLKNMGEFYSYTKDHKKAVETFKKAWDITEDNQMLNEQKKIAEQLYKQYKHLNNSSKSLEWHEKFVDISDSLNSKEDQQEIGKQFAQFEFTNIRLKDSLEQTKKDEIQQIKIAQQEKNIKNEKLKKYYLYGGLLITFLLLIGLLRRFNITKKQKRLIELQKTEMERKQIELSKTYLAIKDSINYSKKIQKAIFPSKIDFDSIFNDNFILFKPKDVISGDFYWCYKKGNKKIITVADCTGHGVPGAFMTIVGINILKEIIQEGVIDSSIILKEINSKLKKRLGQNGESVKDGMDLGICIIDDTTIEFCGAHFPLYHISENEFVEYKGNNLFLGNEENMDNITTHYIPYKTGDLIYLSTDGFPDQRGGEKGKKYFYKPLRKLIHKNSHLPMDEQNQLLKSEFENWTSKGSTPQMDDVSIVGIKL